MEYFYVKTVGSCVILAEVFPDFYSDEPIIQFFAAQMLSREGKLAYSLAEAKCACRITSNRGNFLDLVNFFRGYDACAHTGKHVVMPEDWKFKQVIDAAQVVVPEKDTRRYIVAACA